MSHYKHFLRIIKPFHAYLNALIEVLSCFFKKNLININFRNIKKVPKQVWRKRVENTEEIKFSCPLKFPFLITNFKLQTKK